MTSSLDKHIVELKREYPEWQPWLAVVQEILDETVNPVWDAIVPVRTGPQQRKVPLLTGMTLNVEQSLIGRLLEQLIRVAAVSGTPKMATLKTALHADFDILSLFKASLCHDSDHIKELAAVLGSDAAALQAVADLVPLPALHACNSPMAAIDFRKLDGRLLSRVRRLAGLCRGARHRAQPLFSLWPLRGRVAGAMFVLPLLRYDQPQRACLSRAGKRRLEFGDRCVQALSRLRKNFYHAAR